MRFSGFLSFLFWVEKKKHMPFVRVVNYHEVFPKDFANFKKQINWLGKHYTFVSFSEFREFLRGELLLQKPGLLLTFDDALESNYTVLYPFLREHGLHALFFVPVGLLGKNGYMSSTQVKECLDSGIIDIGSHTINHRALVDDLSQSETDFEVIKSKHLLEKYLSTRIDSFCWPFGENNCYSIASFSAFLSAEYRFGFTTYSEPITTGTCSDCLPRTNLQTFWDVSEVAFQMSSYHDRRFRPRKCAIFEHYRTAKNGGRK